MKMLIAAACAVLVLPVAVAAQEQDISRRSYTFLDDRLIIRVHGRAAGELQLVRGEPGRVEVAARSRDGFPGFGLGGTLTRELRLTTVGADQVSFLVIVPDRVHVTVQLPGGASASPSTWDDAVSYRWGGRAEEEAQPSSFMPMAPTLSNGMYLIHSATWAPTLVDVPALHAVRSISLRFEGSEFRIAASRPLSVSPGHSSHVTLDIGGEPVDLVLYVPRGSALFQLRSGEQRLAESVSGRPRALCGNAVVVQRPSPQQDWITFHPQGGRIDCR